MYWLHVMPIASAIAVMAVAINEHAEDLVMDSGRRRPALGVSQADSHSNRDLKEVERSDTHRLQHSYSHSP